jgi:4-azaleucine resistance transporter AzlC
LTEPGNTPYRSALADLAPAVPVVLGYLPIGFAYGVLASNAGLTTLQTVLMSVIVFAGSSQLIAVGLIAQGINPFSIIATTFIVNLRHLLMSASLSPFMRKWRNIEVTGFCFELTDETFGVHSLRFERGETAAGTTMSINVVCQAAWVAGSLLGALAGSLIEDVRPFALDYALPAMFIALLVLQLRGRLFVWVALLSGAASMAIWGAGLTQWNVILATIVGATVGALVETLQKRYQLQPGGGAK